MLARLGIRADRPDLDGPRVEDRSAFAVHTNSIASAIRLNVVGREPRGRVRPEAYDAHCRFLAASFAELVDPVTGRRLVSEVVPVAERYPGSRATAFADLLVVWNGDVPIASAASAAIGEVTVARGQEPPGNHRSGGWLVAAGPGIAAGRATRPAAIVDFAPTAAAILGVDLRDVEGVPMFEPVAAG